MASRSLFSRALGVVLVVVLGLLSTATVSEATSYQINWTFSPQFPFPAGNKLYVGDELVFTYDNTTHNLLKVNKTSFDSCDATDPIKTFTDGDTTIDLKNPGDFYYICGFPNHCDGSGMKLRVTVMNGTASAAPAPAPAPYFGPAPSPSHATGGRPHMPTSVMVVGALLLGLVSFLRH